MRIAFIEVSPVGARAPGDPILKEYDYCVEERALGPAGRRARDLHVTHVVSTFSSSGALGSTRNLRLTAGAHGVTSRVQVSAKKQEALPVAYRKQSHGFRGCLDLNRRSSKATE